MEEFICPYQKKDFLEFEKIMVKELNDEEMRTEAQWFYGSKEEVTAVIHFISREIEDFKVFI